MAACANVSPERIATDRMDFGQVIAESWKRQTLLNVVRMRYGDALTRIQLAGAVGIRVEPRTNGRAVILVLPRVDTPHSSKRLGLQTREFVAVDGAVSEQLLRIGDLVGR